MTTFIIRRIFQAIPVLLGISIFTFLMVHLIPGDPVEAFAGEKPLPPAMQEQIRARYGFNEPLLVQYRNYMSHLLRGDLGESYKSKRPVTDSIREAMGPTIVLTVAGLLVAIFLGVSLVFVFISPQLSLFLLVGGLIAAGVGFRTSTRVATQNLAAVEMERVARQGLSDYLRSHGMEDQTIESIAVK